MSKCYLCECESAEKAMKAGVLPELHFYNLHGSCEHCVYVGCEKDEDDKCMCVGTGDIADAAVDLLALYSEEDKS